MIEKGRHNKDQAKHKKCGYKFVNYVGCEMSFCIFDRKLKED